jgi:hypothetical protein
MEDDKFKTCPYCKEKICKEAVKCRFCGEWLEKVSQADAVLPQTPNPVETTPGSLNVEPIECQPHITQNEEGTMPRTRTWKTSPKFLTLISIVLLIFCCLVPFVGLKGSNLSATAVELLSKIIVNIVIGAGCFAWIVWGIVGKRREYGLLAFSVACTILVAISTYYFHVAKQAAKERMRESNMQFSRNVQELFSNNLEFAQHGAAGALPDVDIQPTGNAEDDEFLQFLNNFSREIAQYFGNMNKEIEALQEHNVFDESLLTIKSNLEAEIPKRIESQKIIERYQQGLEPMLEAMKQKLMLANISESARRSVLQGIETFIEDNRAQIKEKFGLLVKTEQTEFDFLTFMAGAYKDYKYKDGMVFFLSPTNSQKYEELTKRIQETMKEADVFQKQCLEAAKTKLQNNLEQLRKLSK